MRKLLSVLFSTLQGGVRGGLLLLLFFASVSAVYASNTQVDGIWYDFDSSTKTASVTYRGYNYNSDGEYSGSVVIPETVTYNGTTYSVTSIGDYAFYDCSSLTSVTIPNSVTSIGDYAFYKCTSLTSITIPESVKSIGDCAFYECTSLTSVTIPNSVTSIGSFAFRDCSSLTSVTIGESVKSIGSSAFEGCSSLTKTNYPGDIAGWCNIKFSDAYANPIGYSHNFYINNQEIKDLVIPNSVTSIGNYAFFYCYSLTSVTIPESVTSIGNSAFRNCSSLTSVNIGESVTSIGSYAFYDCSSLTSVTIPESVTSIGDDAFYYCSSLTSVTIPNSVTSIGSSAFYNCSSLTKTNYTGNIASWCNIKFGNYSANPMYYSHNFYINDQEIKDLVIPNSVTSIGGYAFDGCSSLTSVTIPNSVTSIGNYAFDGCSSLTSVTIPNSVTSIGNGAFEDCSSLTSVTIPNSVTSIGDYAFRYCSSLTSVTIPESVTSIGNSAFRDCSSLTSVTIGESVTSIGDYAFRYCSSLTSVTIGESVTSIGSSAFADCRSLTSVTIPNSVTSIGSYAFNKCSSLTSVTIGNSVTSIESKAFANCSSLTSITCEAITPPTIGEDFFGEDAFYGVSSSTPVYVPCGCVKAYKAASGWSDFTNIQEPLAKYSIEVNVNDATMGTAKVNYNTFCEGNQISAKPNFGYHFVQWSDGNTDAIRTLELTQDTILTAEFAQPFSGQCGDNLYWSYNETVKTISITGSGKMYDYTADTQPWLLFKEQLVEVTTNNTVTSIGTSAFEGCVRLAKISLGTGLEDIAANAFAGCTRLYDVYCYATYPPFAEQLSFANYHVYLYVPCESRRNYTLDVVWGNFMYIKCIESEDVSTNGVVITPSTNDVTITWPTEGNADTYTIVIKTGNEVFCTLTFNADGQLLNIAFAPGRDGNHPAQYAEQAGNGYRFTVTGLEEGTHYAYNIDVKDAANKTIKSYTGEFTTESLTAVENTHSQSPTSDCQKILRNGQLLILRDGKTYTIMGQEI